MKAKYAVAVLGLAAAAFALPAAAQMRTPSLSSAYIGANIGQSKTNFDCEGAATCDQKDTAFRIFAGYQFNRNFAAELGYANVGKAHFADVGGSADVKTTAWDLSAIGAFPVMDRLSIFGRLGLYLADVKIDSTDGSDSKNSSGLTYGLGVQYDFTRNVGVRAEWQRYNSMKTPGEDSEKFDADVLSLGVLWRFQ